MHWKIRPRQLASVAVVAGLALATRSVRLVRKETIPTRRSTTRRSSTRRSTLLWDKLLFWGTLVFVFVEGILLYTIFRYPSSERRRRAEARPRQHDARDHVDRRAGVILVFIAVPTVRTIFRTQARAVPNALQVEVIGHQWWWEFRYPQYTTQLPSGRVDTW